MSLARYNYNNMLITGGAGFIGSHFIRYLIKNEPTVNLVNFDLLTYAGSLKQLDFLADEKRYTFIQGDITHAPLVEKILSEYRIDTIVHFAAESHVDRSISGPAPFIHTNVVGTFTLLEAAKKYGCRFHHISTDEVYGSLSLDAAPFHEQSPYAPNSPYSASKAGSDHLVRAYFHTYQLPITISHCSNNYGPHQHPEKFIPTVIQACLTHQPIPIYGDGSNIRDWIYVEDHCKGVIEVIRQGQIGDVYHLGGEHEMTNLEVAQLICHYMDEFCPKKQPHADLITFVSDRPGHDWRYAMDISKARQVLGWSPKETFNSGLKKTIEFYLSFLS